MLTNLFLGIIVIELLLIYGELKTNPYPKLTLHQLAETHSYTKYLAALLGNIFGLLSIVSARADPEKTIPYLRTLKEETKHKVNEKEKDNENSKP